MGLWQEYKKLWRTNTLNAAVLTISLVYGIDKVGKASSKDKDDFYGIKQMGATTSTSTTTSSSHPMTRAPAGDMMAHPTALFGYKNIGSNCTGGVHGHCTNPSCTNCGAMSGIGASASTKVTNHAKTMVYGEGSHTSPSQLSGASSAIRRRTMINSEDTDAYSKAQVSHLFGHDSTPSGMSPADVEAIAGMAGF